MKYLIVFLLSVLTSKTWGLTQEEIISKVTVRLVRKSWGHEGYNPGTDEPLLRFQGSVEELFALLRAHHSYDYVSEPLATAKQLFDNPNYNASQPSVLLTHPLTVGDSVFITETIGALALRNLQKHYNIFAMHAPWLSLHFQSTCARTAFGFKTMFEPMAEAFSTFLVDGYKMGKIRPEQISFIGFSYSATLNAYIARYIKNVTGFPTHTIFALDAFQMHIRSGYFQQVTSEDAMLVHMIHSSSKFAGTKKRVATVDIVLNNGYLQPGCGKVYILPGCSHRRSVSVFLYTLISAGNTVARKCDSWDSFQDCECNDESGDPILIVSFPVNQEARGVFFVRTTDKYPFVVGPKGAYCESEENISYNDYL